MNRVCIMVIDGFGLGASPDAHTFGDTGANTFGHIAQACQSERKKALHIPNLSKLGLVNAGTEASGYEFGDLGATATNGAFGYAQELSTGKDTPSGHWEMAGVPVLFDWGYFEPKKNSFPDELVAAINAKTGYQGMLGNCHASGTEILKRLGDEHIKTGLPICYTSADSVFQVAAHEDHFGLQNLLDYCEAVREILNDWNIGRVIARPFIGDCADNYARTGNRRDLSVLPPSTTVLEHFTNSGGNVVSVGKIADIYAHQGISKKTKATGLDALVNSTLDHLNTEPANSIIFTNLVNFDQDYGHRRDVMGYANALEQFDARLPDIQQALDDNDLLILTADHGCDPTWEGTEHTREYIPVIVYRHGINSVNLGKRDSFADIGQTIADYFNLKPLAYGESFLDKIS